jgi:hypothetical protein
MGLTRECGNDEGCMLNDENLENFIIEHSAFRLQHSAFITPIRRALSR